jgi:Rrf2 family protein
MAANTQFSIAVHALAGLAYRGGKETVSADLAGSVNTSPSFVRRVLAKLSKAGLVETRTGPAGSSRLARKAKDISLRDIYRAVGAPKAIAIHHYAELKCCPVSCHIKEALGRAQGSAQTALEASLAEISLADVLRDIRRG